MHTKLSTKITALMLALLINGVIMGSVAVVFDAQAHDRSSFPVVAITLHETDDVV